jgi:hypothetical protein
MKILGKLSAILLAAGILFWGSVFAAGKLQFLDGKAVEDSTWTNPAGRLPGVYQQFQFSRIPEMQNGKRNYEDQLLLMSQSPDDSRLRYPLGSHRLPVIPASEAIPPVLGETPPLVHRHSLATQNFNEEEDARQFVSDLYSDTRLYSNYTSGAKNQSSRDRGFFYEENLRYELFSLKDYDDSLSFQLDTTHSNDKREFQESFTLNHISLESRTPKSLLAGGHTHPEFSPLAVSQPILGFYGMQSYHKTTLKGFGGYRALEADDLKNPREAYGVRLEHGGDEAVIVGVNAVGTADSRSNPGADEELPTLRNRLYSMDVKVKPTDNLLVYGEFGQSRTEFDLRHPINEEKDQAYRFGGAYIRENCRVEGGVELAGSGFLTPLGESPRDERSYFGSLFYELNRFFSAQVKNRLSRDNLSGYKAATIVRTLPEVSLTVRPSEYYKDLRLDFHYQPFREYSENSSILDRYQDMVRLELNHRIGAFIYYANLSSKIDKDKITKANDYDTYRTDLKLTWEYDAMRNLYGLFSHEQLSYKTAGGFDKLIIYGLGGRSQFQESIFLDLSYTHEANYPKGTTLNSHHDRVLMALTKEYNNFSRFIFEIEGAQNDFDGPARDYSDLVAKVRYLKKF